MKKTKSPVGEQNQELINLTVDVEMAGQAATLLPEKAIFLPDSKTIVVADIHVGKAASFRSRSYFAPDGVTAHDLNRLGGILQKYGAERLIVLGDLVHAQDGLTHAETELFDAFRNVHAAIEMILILGNHDRKARVPSSWQLECVTGAMTEGVYTFAHEYEEHKKKKSKLQYVLSGHIHPSVVLYGQGKQRERLPCFWLRDRYAVLPSFGIFTGSYTIQPEPADKIYVVARDVVIPIAVPV